MAKYDDPWESNRTKPGGRRPSWAAALDALRSTKVSLLVIGGLLKVFLSADFVAAHLGRGRFAARFRLGDPPDSRRASAVGCTDSAREGCF